MKMNFVCSVLLLVLFLTAGDESMMAHARGTCNKQFPLPAYRCMKDECGSYCQTNFGDAAKGVCKSNTEPNDICECHYPC